MELVFALKLLAAVVCFMVGMVLGSLYGAVWLRLAAQWLNFSAIPYITALKCTLISGFVVFAFNFSIGFNQGLVWTIFQRGGSPRQGPNPMDFPFSLFSTNFLYTTMFGLLITAAVLSRVVQTPDSKQRMTFVDALALAAFSAALSFISLLVIGLLIYCIILGILGVTG